MIVKEKDYDSAKINIKIEDLPKRFRWNPVFVTIYHSLKFFLLSLTVTMFIPMLIGNVLMNVYQFYLSFPEITLNAFFYTVGYFATTFFFLSIIESFGLGLLSVVFIFMCFLFSKYTSEVFSQDLSFFHYFYWIFSVIPLLYSIFSFRGIFKKTTSAVFPLFFSHLTRYYPEKISSHLDFFIKNCNKNRATYDNFIAFAKEENNHELILRTHEYWSNERSDSAIKVIPKFGFEYFTDLLEIGYFKKEDEINYDEVYILFRELLCEKESNIIEKYISHFISLDKEFIKKFDIYLLNKSDSSWSSVSEVKKIKVEIQKLSLDFYLEKKEDKKTKKIKI